MQLAFEKGTIVCEGDYNVPLCRWDERTGTNRALGFKYREIVNWLKNSQITFKDDVLDLVSCPDLSCEVDLRPYQKKAVKKWVKEKKGVLVLPTGSGKTFIAMKTIKIVNSPAFIVVPTLDLVDQWKENLKAFDVAIGEFSGREKKIEAITVSTYDSAYLNAENLGNRFKLIIFDEVHHLASEGYRQIAELFASPYRLGLTATFERDDGQHKDLSKVLGGKIFEIEVDQLSGKYLSNYTVKRINVDLKPSEKKKYEEKSEVFKNYLQRSNLQIKSPEDYKKIVLRSGNDPEAWKAVRARNEARKIAYSSESKLDELEKILEKHHGDKIIIFTRYNQLVYQVSKRFLIPAITHKTVKKERKKIFRKFRNGLFNSIVSSQVLDEGIDVPDANIGIILSGTGSTREYTQRLGRILRPSGKEAKLYEIVSRKTSETRTSYRRRR